MAPREPLGWVLYDDACGFCRWWIPFWSATLRKRGFEIAPLQDPWVEQRLSLPPDELIRDLRLLLADGRQVIGADVYRCVMRRISWAWPLYVCSIAPVLRNVFDASYRTFADNRYRVSRTCRLTEAKTARGVTGAANGWYFATPKKRLG
jgi:predicted DCC family thiol-disulfide oxidoreductase YuxK